ncbi:MAG: hypothetical protein NC098_08140 [Lachnoclostridium sp.]|nr:hypothetical protein [Lachnoclostridium sp.]
MKKLVLFMTAALAFSLTAKAQTSQVATLSNGENITTYYSGTALKDAYNAAKDGDIITLSSGTFTATDIKKNVIIRGAGMMVDDNPTIINGDFEIYCEANDDASLTLEGVYVNGKTKISKATNPRIIKCFFKKFALNNANNVTVLHCDIRTMEFGSYSEKPTGNFIGCYLAEINYGQNISSMSFTNCRFWFGGGGNDIGYLYNSTLKNCIIAEDATKGASSYINSSTVATYCYYVGPATDPFKNILSTTNKQFGTDTNITKEGSVTYELPDELATTWLGDDGTQVGMHGGFIPFDPTPTNPQITKFNVASKTTADGKLSVDIEVKAN